MLDIRRIRADAAGVKVALARRNDPSVVADVDQAVPRRGEHPVAILLDVAVHRVEEHVGVE